MYSERLSVLTKKVLINNIEKLKFIKNNESLIKNNESVVNNNDSLMINNNLSNKKQTSIDSMDRTIKKYSND